MKSGRPLITFLLLPERTAFNASFTLARRLEEAGFRVAYIGPPLFRDHVAAQGFAYRALLPDPPQLGLQIKKTGLGTWWEKLRRSTERVRAYHDDLMKGRHDIEAWIEENPDILVLLDPLMWEFSPPLLKRGVSIAGFCSTLTAKLDLCFPPIFSDLIPADDSAGALARIRYAVAWAKILLQIVGRDALEALILYAALGPIRFRRENAQGLVKKNGGALRYGEYGRRLDVPELIAAPRSIDFPPVAAQQSRIYVGACVDCQRNDEPFNWHSLERGKPLVYCSLGTYSHFYASSAKLFAAVIEVLKDDKEQQAIIQAGDAFDAADLGTMPSHIVLTRFVPQLEVLNHASVFITHGGFGSLREGLFYGVPMIVFPCWLDQFGNAARIERYRLGVRGDIRNITPHALRDLLDRARAPEIRASVGRMQSSFQQHEDCEDGLTWIRQFLSARKIELSSCP
jgi:UDP:flavonoid glycosyltransferase YjiC (YdhE family)